MILSDNTKRLIDALLGYEPDLPNGFYSVTTLQEKLPGISTVMVLESMANRGLIRWGDKQHTAFWLLEEARAYKNIEKLEGKERWKERLIGFVFGIAAGVATGLLVAWLTGLIA